MNVASTKKSGSFITLFTFIFLNVPPECPTFDQNFVHSTRMWSVPPEFQTFDRHFELSPGISNVRPEARTSDRNFERSAGLSSVRPESRTFRRKFECSARIQEEPPSPYCPDPGPTGTANAPVPGIWLYIYI